MKWKGGPVRSKIIQALIGDKPISKVEEKFLWLPLTLKGETKWLTTVKIKYTLGRRYSLFNPTHGEWKWQYKPTEFINGGN
jgi:hypothetical protein